MPSKAYLLIFNDKNTNLGDIVCDYTIKITRTYLIASIQKCSKFAITLLNYTSHIDPDDWDYNEGWILWNISDKTDEQIEAMITSIKIKHSRYHFNVKITFQIFEL